MKNSREHHCQTLQDLLAELGWLQLLLLRCGVSTLLGFSGRVMPDLAQDRLEGLGHLVVLHRCVDRLVD